MLRELPAICGLLAFHGRGDRLHLSHEEPEAQSRDGRSGASQQWWLSQGSHGRSVPMVYSGGW